MKKVLFTLTLAIISICCLSLCVACGKDNDPPAPDPIVITITGVENNQEVVYPAAITPVFDKGTATLSVDGGIPSEFTSGTQLTNVGTYVLTVTEGDVVETINFKIVVPTYPGSFTDEFVQNKPNGTFFSSDGVVSFENEDLVFVHEEGGDPWSICKRQYIGINATENPYLMFNIKTLKDGHVEVNFKLEEFGSNIASYTFSANGIYVIDVKSLFTTNELNLTNQDIWINLCIVGSEGEMKVVFDYLKSVSEVPALTAAPAYVDKTPETLSNWITDDAALVYEEELETAVGTIISTQAYGAFKKRVNFNTKAYPYLIVDVGSVVNSYAIKAYKYVNYQQQPTEYVIVGDSNKVGKNEINLVSIFGESENVDVILSFYIIGKQDDKYFTLKGLETVAEPIYDIVASGINNGDTLFANSNAKITFDKGTATIKKGDETATTYVSGTAINDIGSYVVEIKAGQFTKTINFTLIEKVQDPTVFESFMSSSDFTTEGGSVTKDSNGFIFTKSAGNNMAKLAKRYNLNVNGKYFVIKVQGLGGYVPDSGFGFEILNDFSWHAYKAKFDQARYVDIKDGVYTIYFEVTKAQKTDSSQSFEDWLGTTVNNVKLSINIEYGDEKSVKLFELAFVDELPVFALDSLKDTSKWTKSGEAADLTYSETDGFKFYKTEGSGVSKIQLGNQDLYFTAKQQYIVLKCKALGSYANGLDAGFSITLLNEGSPWQQKQIRASSAICTQAIDGIYTYYFDVTNTAVTNLSTPADTSLTWSNKTMTVKTEIVMEYGCDRGIIVLGLDLYNGIPDQVISTLNSVEDWTKEGEAADLTYSVTDGFKFYKTAGTSVSKIGLKKQKLYFSQEQQYVVLKCKALGSYENGLDAGFSIVLLNQGSPWQQKQMRASDATYVKSSDGVYTYYFDVTNTAVTNLSTPEDTSLTWSNVTMEIYASIVMEYGYDRGIEAISLELSNYKPQ